MEVYYNGDLIPLPKSTSRLYLRSVGGRFYFSTEELEYGEEIEREGYIDFIEIHKLVLWIGNDDFYELYKNELTVLNIRDECIL